MKLFEVISDTKTRGKDIAVVSACDSAQAVDTLRNYGKLNYDPSEYDRHVVKELSPYSKFVVPKIVSEDVTGAAPTVEGDVPKNLTDLLDVNVERACDGDVLIRKGNSWVPSPLPELDGSDKNYVFYQNSPSAIWSINHCLGKIPSVTVLNSGMEVVYGDIIYDERDPGNKLTIHFSIPVSGTATLN